MRPSRQAVDKLRLFSRQGEGSVLRSSQFITSGLIPDNAESILARLKESMTHDVEITDQLARELYRAASLIHEHALNKAAFV